MINRWKMKGGYRDVLALGLPLVASMGSFTLMEFTDSLFLGHYSVDAMAAVLPGSHAAFLFRALFLGVVTYLNVFMAQYVGAQAPHRLGAVLWQGLWFCGLAGAVMACLWFAAGPLFDLAGHGPAVRGMETAYFRILCVGSVLNLSSVALSCFFSGRGLTRTVMLVHMTGAAVNIPLDYCLINGVGPFPELGIVGAGLATVASWGVTLVLFARLAFSPGNEAHFKTRSARGLEPALLGRLLRYGLPGGVQFFLDVFAFTFFVFMVGRLGMGELAATNIVFALNNVAFLPMVGFHIALCTMVGQAVGGGRPEAAVAGTVSTAHLALAYTALVSLGYLLLPETLMEMFRARDAAPEQWREVLRMGTVLLRFVAVYCLFDSLALVFSATLKGAGDIGYVMWSLGVLSVAVLIVPVYAAVEWFQAGIYVPWLFVALYTLSLSAAFWWRYRRGAWKAMRVVETAAPIS